MTYSDTYSDTYVGSTVDYQYVTVPWGQLETTLHELVPGEFYDVSVAAYDHAGRTSGFNTDVTATASSDTIAPGTPAAPSAVGSPLNVQVSHTLGLNTGGTYNLPKDLDHLNVYIDTTLGFPTSSANKVGAIPVTSGHLLLGIPAIGTFPFPDDTPRYVRVTAVDRSGNESDASVEAAVTPGLIDTAQIAELAVKNANIDTMEAGKLTAGTITGHEIIIAGGASGILRSDNYVQGSDGWKIDGAGNFEANDAIFRGAISGNLEGTLTVIDTWDNDLLSIGTVFNDGIVVGGPQIPGLLTELGLHKDESFSIATRGSIYFGSHTGAGTTEEGMVFIGEQDFSGGSADLFYSKALDVGLFNQAAFDVLAEWYAPNSIDETQAWFRGYEGVSTKRWEIGNAGLMVDQSDVKAPLMETATVTDQTDIAAAASFTQWGTEEIDIAWPASTPCRVMAWGLGAIQYNSGGGKRDVRITISFDGGSSWDSPASFDSGYVDVNDDWMGVSPVWMKTGTPTGNIQVRLEYRSPNSGVDLLNGRMFCLVLGDI